MNIIRNAVIKALEQNHVNDEIEVEFNDRNLKILVPKNAEQEIKVSQSHLDQRTGRFEVVVNKIQQRMKIKILSSKEKPCGDSDAGSQQTYWRRTTYKQKRHNVEKSQNKTAIFGIVGSWNSYWIT